MLNIVQKPKITRISFVSNKRFKTCLLKEGGGMSKSSDLSKSEESSLSISSKSFLENLPKAGVVNVYGKHGIGKTTFFSRIKHVKFDHEILKSKERTCDFMDMMKYSFVPLVLDDYELIEGSIGLKELRKLRVPFYIVSLDKLTSIECVTDYYEFPGVSVEEFATSIGLPVEYVRGLLEKSNGNMTRVVLDIENFTSVRDVFLNSKQYVHTLCTTNSKKTSFIDKHLFEHGNTFGIIHENYPDFSTDFVNISKSLSDADLIDKKIYADVSWDLMPYFNVSACLIPSLYFEKEPSVSSLRPGSVWTKNSNMLMKMNRLKKLRIPRDNIYTWALKANNGDDVPFDPYDLDSINQLSFTKIKSKVLTSLKKNAGKGYR